MSNIELIKKEISIKNISKIEEEIKKYISYKDVEFYD